jgi:hypothetical protein
MTAGQYNHNLTLIMLKSLFLLAGGAENKEYRSPLPYSTK